jgi:hypothetical protein
MDGSPVQGATVVFLNRDSQGRPALGITNAEGRFSLRTYLRPNEEPKGALPGEYDITVVKQGPPLEGPNYIGPFGEGDHLLAEKYRKLGSLEARVSEGEPNTFVFDLDPPP